MPTKSSSTIFDSPWAIRIKNAERVRKAWETRFECQSLEDYFEGFQWKKKKDQLNVNYRPYVINMVYSTIKIKQANLLFQKPTYTLNPSPGNSHWNLDFAVQSTQIKQDTLNTIIHNPNMNFTKHAKRALKDSYFRFGLIEVGYAADWKNPQKESIQLKSWEDSLVTEDDDKVVDDNVLPINERFFIKRINPKKFIVNVSDALDLNDHDWCGYHEYIYTNQLQHTKGIKWPANVSTAYQGAEYAREISDGNDNGDIRKLMTGGAVSKVYHIFDIVSKKRRLLLDGEFQELWCDSMERLPIRDIRWDERSEGFYPIPPVFQWLSPQDEINEAREQMRSYRKRFTAKYQYVKGQVEIDEIEKFTSGPDGITVEVKEKDAIGPIENPTLSSTNPQDLTIARDEFNIVSGTSADARGQDTDRTTATQSKIIDARTQIRESAEQMDYSVFLCDVGKEILAQASEKLVEGLWVKYSADPDNEGLMADMKYNAPLYKFITSNHINDGYDFTIEMDIQNGTPAAMQAAQQAYVGFITFVQANPMVAMSPVLIRETAYRFNYRNEQVIHQLQQAIIMSMAAKAAQENGGNPQTSGQPGGGTNPTDEAKTQQKQMGLPSPEQTSSQINTQIQ